MKNFKIKSKAVSLLLILCFIFASASCGAQPDVNGETSTLAAESKISEESPQETSTEALSAEYTYVSEKYEDNKNTTTESSSYVTTAATTSKNNTPETNNKYSGKAYTVLNGNVPPLAKEKPLTFGYENYGELDSLGRCTQAYARVSKETMPTEERGAIGSVKPTGWHTVKYDIVDGKYLYNRCHLIGYQLSAENANEKNLITGTRYMNVNGMLPFENMVADYIKETGNSVLYRVTPDFRGNELLARGVEIEAYSVEDSGDGICFDVYCYNVQPGIDIDYSTGDSKLSEKAPVTTEATTKNTVPPVVTKAPQTTQKVTEKPTEAPTVVQTVPPTEKPTVPQTEKPTEPPVTEVVSYGSYIGNADTGKFHKAGCSSVKTMNEENKVYADSREFFLNNGYEPCKRCNP